MRRTHLVLLVGLAVVVAACGGEAETADTTTTTAAGSATTTEPDATTTTTVEESMSPSITFEADGWPTLANGFHYEGWAIVDGQPVSTGKFNVVGGELVGLDGQSMAEFVVDEIASVSTIVVTIEPAGDTDDIPADTHFVAGDVVSGTAELTISHPAALGTDFSEAGGTFLLATPTDNDDSNELSGIWFLALPGPVASLDLPDLPAGWNYEGWGVVGDTPVTTGTFRVVDAADDSAPYSGPNTGPNFPGEDFLLNAPEGLTFPTDLSGATVVVSVEPSPDDDPAPFVLKPLLGTAAENATDHESYAFDLNPDALPTGRATLNS